MLSETLQFLIHTLFGLLATAFGLRFYMQWARVPFHHPFAQFIILVTDFAVLPLRRVVPGWFGVDWASLKLFFICEIVLVTLEYWVDGYPFLIAGWGVAPGFVLLGIAAGLQLALQVLILLIIAQAVLSWVAPVSSASAMFHALTAPVLNPLRRVIPTVSGVDLSPLAAFVLIELLLMVPVTALERAARLMIQ